VWFRKERVIVNDEKFFTEDSLKSDDLDDDLEKNWQERDYVVASTLVKPQDGRRSASDAPRTGRKRRGKGSTVVKRGVAESATGSFQRGERRRKPGTAAYEEHQKRLRESEEKARRIRSEREADLFGLDGNQPDVTDFYEDEVFNVNNLPKANEYPVDEPRDTEEQ